MTRDTYHRDPALCLCWEWRRVRQCAIADHHPGCRGRLDPLVHGLTLGQAVAQFGPFFPAREAGEPPHEPRTYTPVSPEEAEAATRSYAAGETLRQIGDRLGRGVSTVRTIMVEHGVPLRRRGYARRPEAER